MRAFLFLLATCTFLQPSNVCKHFFPNEAFMRYLIGMGLLPLALACGAYAQTQGNSFPASRLSGLQQSQAVEAPASQCPMGFMVTRVPARTLRPAAGSGPDPDYGSGLDLSLTPMSTSAID